MPHGRDGIWFSPAFHLILVVVAPTFVFRRQDHCSLLPTIVEGLATPVCLYINRSGFRGGTEPLVLISFLIFLAILCTRGPNLVGTPPEMSAVELMSGEHADLGGFLSLPSLFFISFCNFMVKRLVKKVKSDYDEQRLRSHASQWELQRV